MQIIKRTLLFIGPFPPPIHGESVAMEQIYSSENLHQLFRVKKISTNRKNINNQGKFSFSKLTEDIWLICYFIILVCMNKSPITYLSLSQSKLGLIRDCIIIYIASIRKAKIITHLHGNNLSNVIDDLNNGIFQRFVISALMKIDIGIVLDSSLAFNYKGLVKNVRTVPNGVPIDFITPEDLKKKKTRENVSILYFSNLIKSKGYIRLIKAACTLIKENYNIQLNLVGAIHDEKEFLEVLNYIKTNNLDKKIVYHGIKTGKEKKQFFLNTDILVLPTNYHIEGQPISIIEGMAAGLAIISTNKGAIPALLNDCGVIIEPEILEITESIKELYHNVHFRNRLGLASRLKYEKCYTDRNYINALMQIFIEVTK